MFPCDGLYEAYFSVNGGWGNGCNIGSGTDAIKLKKDIEREKIKEPSAFSIRKEKFHDIFSMKPSVLPIRKISKNFKYIPTL